MENWCDNYLTYYITGNITCTCKQWEIPNVVSSYKQIIIIISSKHLTENFWSLAIVA